MQCEWTVNLFNYSIKWDNIASLEEFPAYKDIGNVHCSWFVIWVNFKAILVEGTKGTLAEWGKLSHPPPLNSTKKAEEKRSTILPNQWRRQEAGNFWFFIDFFFFFSWGVRKSLSGVWAWERTLRRDCHAGGVRLGRSDYRVRQSCQPLRKKSYLLRNLEGNTKIRKCIQKVRFWRHTEPNVTAIHFRP